ncbi:MAG: ABC transporter substrate-binding protein [Ahrensia sp.]|nr:ABC transporter substrate-binding protein [Ahrensia sp.]
MKTLATALIGSIALAYSFSAAHAEPPEEARMLDFASMEKIIGKKGGAIDILMAKAKDVRQMTVYSNARLVHYDQTFTLVPDILAEVKNEGNKVFTLRLRRGHNWSDGTPFTTEDFRYWWEDVANNEELEPGGIPREMMSDGKPPKVEIIDSHTIRYSWDSVNPLFLTALAGARPMYIYMPAHYMKQWHSKYADADTLAAKIESENVQNWTSLHKRFGRQYRPENPDLPTLQPWMTTTKLPSERIVFKANPHFHRVDPNGTQLPYIQTVNMNIASKDIIAAKAGTGETAMQGRYLRFDNYAFLKQGAETGGFDVYLWPTGKGSEMVLLPNLNAADKGFREAFQDVRVRRALSLGIDRNEINETIFFGLGRPSANSVLPSSPLFTDAHANAWAELDVGKANTLLDEAGFDKKSADGTRLMPDGREFEIIVETEGDSQDTDILQLIADHWKSIGVKLFIKPSQRDILRGRVANGEAVMTTWEGLNRGLATPDMNPEELAPVSPVQGQWPAWGAHYETNGTSGEAITLPDVKRIAELYASWKSAETYQAQAAIWQEMLTLFTDNVYSIGTVSGGLQPIVVSNALRNVPREGIWSFEPTLYFGHYLPDTFWLDE